VFAPGAHATTFGAGPVVMEAARVVLQALTAPGFLDQVRSTGEYFLAKLNDLARAHGEQVAGVRGLGLMLGLELTRSGVELVGALLKKGFVVNCTQDKVLRFLPPLIVGPGEIDALAVALDEVLT